MYVLPSSFLELVVRAGVVRKLGTILWMSFLKPPSASWSSSSAEVYVVLLFLVFAELFECLL